VKLNIAIIGSGIGGLAAAIRLAVRGHDVSVYEQSDRPGGMIQEKEWNGYRWDIGPTTLLMPDQAEELFLLAGEEMKVSVRSSYLEQIARYYFPDGLILDTFGDVDAFCKEMEEKTGEPAKRVYRYLNSLRKRYEITSNVLRRFSFTFRDAFLLPGLARALLLALRHDFLFTAHGMNKRAFKSEYAVWLFDWLASSQGSNPYRARSTSNLNAHFIQNLGVYYPEKGMNILAKELYQLAIQMGVTFFFNEKVEGIDLKQRTVKGMYTNKGYIKSDIVISNADIHQVHKELLPGYNIARKYLKQELSNSAIVFCWAVDREFPGHSVKNVLFSPDQKGEYYSLMNGKVFNHPTIQLHISSKGAPSDAPEGCENWVLMVKVPANTGQDWDAEVLSVRKEAVSRINKLLDTDIEKHIKKEYKFDPRSIEKDFASFRGSLYGSNNNRILSSFRRHPNFLNNIHGLYFVGRTVHPGGGIPMSLTSAMNIDLHIERHYSFRH
jgi:phytoene desaturase